MAQAGKALYDAFFEYETPKMLNIRNKKVGIFNRCVQLIIFMYIVGSLVYEKSYQEVENLVTSSNTKMKGVAYANVTNHNIPALEQYNRIFDVSDYVIPSQESNAFFIMTNFVVTPNQTRGICDEDVDFKQARCVNDTDCPVGVAVTNGNGIRTGRCIPSSRSTKYKVCEVSAWCPVEIDALVEERPLLAESKDFTVLIKNYVDFPKFKIKRRNILDSQSKEFLRGCRFNSSHPDNRLCPIFRLGTIVEEAGADYDELALKGGIIVITIEWKCDFDRNVDECQPEYSFRRLDEHDTKLSAGWNFRYSHYYATQDGVDRRTLVKAYGIRFIVEVVGEGRKFHILPLMVTIGSGVGLLAISSIVSDFVVFHVLTHRSHYKVHQVDVVDVCASDVKDHEPDMESLVEHNISDKNHNQAATNGYNQAPNNSTLKLPIAFTRVPSISERRPLKLQRKKQVTLLHENGVENGKALVAQA